MTVSSDTTSHPEAAKRATRSVAFITLAACLIFWVFVFADSGWGPTLTPLSSYLHISLVSAGLLYVVWSTGYLPGALVGGTLLIAMEHGSSSFLRPSLSFSASC